jgi:hypothetical protein
MCPIFCNFCAKCSDLLCDPRCALCGELKDTEHIFFQCPLAKFVWCCIGSWLHVCWSPSSFADLRVLTNGLSGISKRVFWVGFVAICWSLWTTRNKFTIEHSFPAKPVDCLFKTGIFLQQWRSLARDADHEAFDMMTSKIRPTATSLGRRQSGV